MIYFGTCIPYPLFSDTPTHDNFYLLVSLCKSKVGLPFICQPMRDFRKQWWVMVIGHSCQRRNRPLEISAEVDTYLIRWGLRKILLQSFNNFWLELIDAVHKHTSCSKHRIHFIAKEEVGVWDRGRGVLWRRRIARSDRREVGDAERLVLPADRNPSLGVELSKVVNEWQEVCRTGKETIPWYLVLVCNILDNVDGCPA